MSSADRPTLAALRSRAHKGRHREIGNWLARRVGRPTAIYGSWLAIRLGLSANQVTLGALGAVLASAVAFGWGTRAGFVAGVALAHLAFWLDHVDGQVARWRGTASLDGVFLDYLLHHVWNLSLGFALGHGLGRLVGEPAWSVAGFAIGAGWTLLNLTNDCRYKAFFQELKRTNDSFLVVGGAGGRPSPPARWPRRGLAMAIWPMFKSCEIHVVLLGLTFMAIAALVSDSLWISLYQACVFGMALTAPVLAAGRVRRMISGRAASREFQAWFRPIDRAGADRVRDDSESCRIVKS